jgi:DNA-binding NtrC family response regulator
LRILVVDDNHQFCDNLKDLLELQGHQVAATYSGAEAVEEVKKAPPNVVLLDAVMPGMDGLATLEAIMNMGAPVPVIMMTGFSGEELLGHALQAGAVALIQKPPDYDELFSLIERSVAGRRGPRAGR